MESRIVTVVEHRRESSAHADSDAILSRLAAVRRIQPLTKESSSGGSSTLAAITVDNPTSGGWSSFFSSATSSPQVIQAPAARSRAGTPTQSMLASAASVTGGAAVVVSAEPIEGVLVLLRQHAAAVAADVVERQKTVSARAARMDEECARAMTTMASRVNSAQTRALRGSIASQLASTADLARQSRQLLADVMSGLERLEEHLEQRERITDPINAARYPCVTKLKERRARIAETENLDATANLFSILVATDALEKAYIRDAVPASEFVFIKYTAHCTRLIAQFKTARDLLPPGLDMDQFMREYKLTCPAATKRLLEIGVPATVEHAVAESGASTRQHVKAVADITTCFITLMDCIKLNMTAMDQLHPLLADLVQGLNKLPGLPRDFEETHKDRLKKCSGNGGTASPDGRITNIGISDFNALADFAVKNNVGLVVPGPEQCLADGIAAVFKNVGLPVFGPSAAAARIESSKAFAKDFMARHQIPTAAYRIFKSFADAKSYVKQTYKGGDFVIKASGLAAGKGVLLPSTIEEAIANLEAIMVDAEFGAAGEEVVIEERLFGEEVSVLTFTDGYTIIQCPGAQDHKRVNEGDEGPNTGGMGAYAPAPIYTAVLQEEVQRTILVPTVNGLRREGNPFVGCLYAGLILTATGPKVIEFNCRFGDPETQVVIPLLEATPGLAAICKAAAEGCLDSVEVRFKDAYAAAVVCVAGGYPGSYKKGHEITLGAAPADVSIIHAGTKSSSGKLLTNGGRVIAVTALAKTLPDAIFAAVDNVSLVKFEGMHFRRDIGSRALALLSKSSQQQGFTYADAGVSIDAGNLLVEKIKSTVKATRRSGADAEIGGFGGVFDIAAAGYGDDTLLVSGTDGVGTKLKIAHLVGKHDTIGIDLVAMSVNDVLVQGAEPLFFLDYYGCSKLEVDVARQVVAGIAEGCLQSNCALIGGETAEMPGMYQPGDYDLAGFVVGAVKRDQLLPRMDLVSPETDVVLGLPSTGVHSNGYSLVRKIVGASGLSFSSACPWSRSATLGEALLTPTKIYVKELLPVLRRGLVKALSHITGGGFTDNIPRCLPKDVGVELDTSSYALPEVFKWLKKQGNISDSELARTFNCGIGMVLIVDRAHVDEIFKLVSELGGGPVVTLGRCTRISQNSNDHDRVKILNATKEWN
ncbi:hypothetical protein HDU84_002715 [Entophlyctis sp. JEL0112]|nr:hypothetical protein HDU84_002715 [Entophlyctis sp. JEL0112]